MEVRPDDGEKNKVCLRRTDRLYLIYRVRENMISSSYANRFAEMFPAEIRLVHRAKSGDVNSFVELYDLSVERIYRYIHFLVPNNGVAEGLTFQTFFKAWEQLDRYQVLGGSFIAWLYSIARNQVIAYHRTHKNKAVPDNEFTLAARGGRFREEFQTLREGMKFLTADQQDVLTLKFIVGMTEKNIARLIGGDGEHIRTLLMQALSALASHLMKIDLRTMTKGFRRVLEDCLTRITSGEATPGECLFRYPEYAPQLDPFLETVRLLNLGRDVKPLPTFNAYTHDALIQYLRSHPRRPRLTVTPAFRRAALTFAMLVAAFLVTGTVRAQYALPGDPFYGWKRTSEEVWHALTPNSVATDLMLVQRRLEEWIAVANNPRLNAIAKENYEKALSRLISTDDEEVLALIETALRSHQAALSQAGLYSPELSEHLTAVLNLLHPIPASAPLIVPTGNSDDPCDSPSCKDEGRGGGNNPNAGGNNPNSGSGNNNAGGNNPNAGGNNPNAGGNNPNAGGNNPNAGGNNPNKGSGNNSGGGNDKDNDKGGDDKDRGRDK